MRLRAATRAPCACVNLVRSLTAGGAEPNGKYPITPRSLRCDDLAIGLHWERPPSHVAPMAANTTIVAALLAGLVSFLSPCVLPLVPPYLVYLAGTSLERLPGARRGGAGGGGG